jgi:hypothetical protein
VPQLTGDGESYAERKLKFLARLYRDAPALPATAGLHMKRRLEDIPGLLS